ncbi:MAG: efflux RND transporter periplasmic adaptor subunit [Desulfobacteraceae bacterium]|nr:MAG: efflux RND transporter periplasmic adaptor subunit [Desulfobacteraceae bacterium]
MLKKGILFTVALLMIVGGISFATLGQKVGHDHSAEKAGKQPKDVHPSPKIEAQHHEDHGEAGHEEEGRVRMAEAERRKFGIEVATAGPGNMASELILPGEVVLNMDRMAHIVPRVPGVVREVRKTVGDSVKRGEVMAVIESRELAKAKADYLAAVEKAALVESKFRREEALWKEQISAEMEYLDAKQAWADAKITLRSEEQRLHALGFSHDYLRQLPKMPDESFTRFEIVAPFDGTIIEKHITMGEVLKEETDTFQVADLTSVWVNISVYQKDLQSVRKGQAVSITTGHDGNPARTPAKAVISFVSPLVKEETRTALARVVLPNPSGEWRPGMFVNVKVTVEEFSAPVTIPKSAVQTLDEKSVVFIEEGDGFEPRQVKMGRSTNGAVEILSGLTVGERFVVKGGFTLKAQLSKAAFGDGHGH